MDLSEITGVFLQECNELLEGMEETLLRLERDPEDLEAIHSIFRAVHTIKGSAGMFGFDRVAQFTHAAESLLDAIRTGGVEPGAGLVDLLIDSRDHLERLVRAAGDGDQEAGAKLGLEAANAELIARIQAADPTARPSGDSPGDSEADASPAATRSGTASSWSIQLKFGPEVFRRSLDPAPFIRHLRELGTLRDVRVLADELPALADLDPERCYSGFRIRIESAASEAQLRSAFEFVEGQCEIEVRRDEPQSSGGSGAVSEQLSARSIRVESERLDQLINLVGELVISMAHLNQLADDSARPEIVESSYSMLKLVSEIRDGAFGLRMFSIGGLFKRFRRVVRDLGVELDKEVRLEIEGAETRLDKTVIEKISDPLMHLIRNAVDHGIESREERVRAGKDPEGRILLNAYNEAGEIVIEITDDGAGLNRERILKKAIERGLVGGDVGMSDARIYDLIFEPGMSTAEAVTSISGRGVGMDVVRRNIEALRGRIELLSPGTGTTIRIRLPLTLAIIDGFLVRVASSFFVFPLDRVEECIEFDRGEYSEHNRVVATREGPLPVVPLKNFFRLEASADDGAMRRGRESLVVVKNSGSRVGVLVDELLGEYQSVIKPLGSVFDELRALSGATILGNGTIAIVLDVPALLKWCEDEAASGVSVDLRAVAQGLQGAL